MPLDATGYQITKTDPFTLEGLRDWLVGEIAAGRGARTYDYFDGKDCLGCRYVGTEEYWALHSALDARGQLGALRDEPWSCQAAHDRTVALIQGARRLRSGAS